jgi:uncharacterized membrane protein YbhN (UPF0104 family)
MAADGRVDGPSTSSKLVTLLLGVAAVAGLVGYLWLERDELRAIKLVGPGFLLASALGMLVNVSANGLLYLLMFRKLGARISYWESFSLTTLSIAANLFLPLRGGAGLRAVYLKRVYGLRYTKFAASLLVFYVLSAVIASLGALAAVSWMMTVQGRPGLSPILVVSLVVLAGSASTVYVPRLRRAGHWLRDGLAAITEGWYELRESGTLLARLLAVAGLQMAGLLVSLWGAAAAIGVRLTLVEILVVGTLGVLSTLISLTPGSLGIYEATVGLAGAAVGMGGTEGVIAALVSRTVLAVLLLALAPLSAVMLRPPRDSSP